MDESATWPRIRNVLDAALELAPELREAYVAEKCPEADIRRQVYSILAAYNDETSFLERPVALASLSSAAGVPLPGDRIGPYLLEKKMGEGGMGAVYLARRADEAFDKVVAIKLLKRGWASEEEIRRFRVERQILADLEHPNIAKLLDGGSTAGGQPYLVMEYVEGLPIDEYCERNQIGIEARIALFLEVCSAVQFAHQNLIVHRDLKPGNILVDQDGHPRLLDFGIAKILAPGDFAEEVEITAAGISPMTPQYASPEQIRGGAITTASDVYSLGVILYRLLTGLPPYRFESRDLKAVVETVCNQDVLPPSTRVRQEAVAAGQNPPRLTVGRLRGDLDAIVLLALAKEPARRYATAEQLADDLRRHLNHEVVRARGGALSYRVSRFVHRHRLGLMSLSIVFLVLAVSVLVLLNQQRQLLIQKNQAEREKNRAEKVSSWLTELFSLPDPGRSLGEKVTARELLDKSKTSIEVDLAGEPELLAALLATLGETYGNLGQLPEANELFASAWRALRATGASSARLGNTLYHLADILSQRGRYLVARKVALLALTHLEQDRETPADLVRCQALLANIEAKLGEFGRAAELFAEVEAPARKLGDTAALTLVLEYAAEFELTRGNLERTLALYQEALDLQRAKKGAGHPDSALLETKLYFALAKKEPARAEALLRDALARQRRLYGGAHPMLAITLNNLGLVVFDQGRLDEAEPIYLESLEMGRQVYGDSHPRLAATLTNLGLLASRRQDLVAAELAFEKALTILSSEIGERNLDYALICSNLGEAELAAGRLVDARRLLEKALEITQEAVGLEHPQVILILNNLAELARREGKPKQARDILTRALAMARGNEAVPAWLLRPMTYNLATLHYDLEELNDARGLFEAVLESDGFDPMLGPQSASHLANIEARLGNPEASRLWAEEALSLFAKAGKKPTDVWVLGAQRTLGRALLELARFDEAEAVLRERLAHLEASRAADGVVKRAEEDLAELAARRSSSASGSRP